MLRHTNMGLSLYWNGPGVCSGLGMQASSCGSPVHLPHPCGGAAGTPSHPSFRVWGWTAAGGTGTREEFAPRFSFLMKLSAMTSVYSTGLQCLHPCCLWFLPAAGEHLESYCPSLTAKSSFPIAPGSLTLQEKPLPGLSLRLRCT